MSVSLTIRNVPKDVRDALASRAARRGRSLQQEVLAELTASARQPTVDEVLDRARARVRATRSKLPAARILAARDAGRR